VRTGGLDDSHQSVQHAEGLCRRRFGQGMLVLALDVLDLGQRQVSNDADTTPEQNDPTNLLPVVVVCHAHVL